MLILNEFSARERVQITAINYIPSQKSYMTLSLAKKSTIHPRDVMKIYYYQQN